ncbi:MAG: AEC family transporter [Ruminococcus sp.]|nr:AEC family transporter [Ruminococcus flavefaciens]MBQ6212649.1 AEC family transporter [Ruminococcus sp.]
MKNLIFSLNATVPVFLMMVFGWFVHRIKLLDDNATAQINRFVFRALLPALLFMDLSTADFRAVWDGKFVLFCMCATLLSVGIAVLYSLLFKDRAERGEIIQASYRSSAAVLGIAFVNNIYGHSTMAALMIVGTVPLYNVVAVTALAVTSPDKDRSGGRKGLLLSTVRSIATNPIILGIIVGISWSLLKIPQPVILSKSVTYLGNMATPLSLIALGASFKIGEAKGKLPVTVGIAFIKLLLFCGIFLPIAVKLGFRGEKLIAILVMLGSATTGSCFVMAKNLGHKGVITAFAVMLTTLLSAFTLTGWLFLLKTLGYI